MNSKFILSLFILALGLVSCEEKAYITVTSKLSGVKIQNIQFGTILISNGSLLPGESTKEYELSDRDGISFPMNEAISFYMIKGDKQVFLKTKEIYSIDDGKTLSIEISDNTEVIGWLD